MVRGGKENGNGFLFAVQEAGMLGDMREPAATSHRGVTRQDVAQAAADLVAAEGLEALSVRQVANRLGVWPTTVVHHAGGRRDGLIPLLIEHLAAGISTDLHGDWRTRLAQLGSNIRRVVLAHRGVADVVLRSGATGPEALRLADAILGALEAAGLAPTMRRTPRTCFSPTYSAAPAARRRRPPRRAGRGSRTRSTAPSPAPIPSSGGRPGAAPPVMTMRASPEVSTSSSTASPSAPRASRRWARRPPSPPSGWPCARARGCGGRRLSAPCSPRAASG